MINLLSAASVLIPFIKDTRSMLASMNLNIPVGTSDAGSYFNNQILEAVDYGVRFVLWKTMVIILTAIF